MQVSKLCLLPFFPSSIFISWFFYSRIKKNMCYQIYTCTESQMYIHVFSDIKHYILVWDEGKWYGIRTVFPVIATWVTCPIWTYSPLTNLVLPDCCSFLSLWWQRLFEVWATRQSPTALGLEVLHEVFMPCRDHTIMSGTGAGRPGLHHIRRLRALLSERMEAFTHIQLWGGHGIFNGVLRDATLRCCVFPRRRASILVRSVCLAEVKRQLMAWCLSRTRRGPGWLT